MIPPLSNSLPSNFHMTGALIFELFTNLSDQMVPQSKWIKLTHPCYSAQNGPDNFASIVSIYSLHI